MQLANEYRRAAETLMQERRRGQPLSHAPFRMVAIHAIELYLNALLLSCGHGAARIRGLQHDLGARNALAAGQRLKLRSRTADHLRSLSQTREYLVVRYDPAASTTSELNRLAATLAEVAEKTTLLIQGRRRDPSNPAANTAAVQSL